MRRSRICSEKPIKSAAQRLAVNGCESRGCRIEVREVIKDVELLVGDLNDVAYPKLG